MGSNLVSNPDILAGYYYVWQEKTETKDPARLQNRANLVLILVLMRFFVPKIPKRLG